MSENIKPQHNRRTVLAGIGASLGLLAGRVPNAFGQSVDKESPQAFSADVAPRVLKKRTDNFIISYASPEYAPKDTVGIAQHVEVFACVLQRNSAGVPTGTIRKNIAFSRFSKGTFTLSLPSFLDANEQLVELSVRSEADSPEHTPLFAVVPLGSVTVEGEPSIPPGFDCTPKPTS
ncbi:MAG: hypothetical protein WAX38_01370 [Minisyncoccia bacterium]